MLEYGALMKEAALAIVCETAQMHLWLRDPMRGG